MNLPSPPPNETPVRHKRAPVLPLFWHSIKFLMRAKSLPIEQRIGVIRTYWRRPKPPEPEPPRVWTKEYSDATRRAILEAHSIEDIIQVCDFLARRIGTEILPIYKGEIPDDADLDSLESYRNIIQLARARWGDELLDAALTHGIGDAAILTNGTWDPGLYNINNASLHYYALWAMEDMAHDLANAILNPPEEESDAPWDRVPDPDTH